MFRIGNRTGRVIALGRVTLAAYLIAALAVEAGGTWPAWANERMGICLGYALFALAHLAASWSSWWREHRLVLPAHLVDLGFFAGLGLVSGGLIGSPLAIFFVFLMLSAGASWGRRAALATAAAVVGLYLAQALIFFPLLDDGEADSARALLRAGQFLILYLMIGWFEFGRRGDAPCPQGFHPLRQGDLVRASLEYAALSMRAKRAALIWSDDREPWLHLAIWSSPDGYQRRQLSPEAAPSITAEPFDGETFLFEVEAQRVLVDHPGRVAPHVKTTGLDPGVASLVAMAEGVATPVRTKDFRGYLVAGEIEALGRDDLFLARRAALEIADALERFRVERTFLESIESRTRLNIARDLHDSLAQLLAGIGLKLRAARRNPDGAEREAVLQELEGELVRHQEYLHEFVKDLRQPIADGLAVDLGPKLRSLGAELEQYWQVTIEVDCVRRVTISRGLESQIENMVREAIANAVRHGEASRIILEAVTQDDTLYLHCKDNGKGFGFVGTLDDPGLTAANAGPRSIQERAHLLNGTVTIASSESGAIVTICLPIGSRTE